MNYTNITSTASLADLFSLVLDKSAPVLVPSVRISTTAEKFEAFLPQQLLLCISPSEGKNARSKGGRPKKNREAVTLPGHDTGSWKTSSYIPFLYNAYRQASARREEMERVLRSDPAGILFSAEKKARAVLYKAGNPRFDRDLLEKALISPSCIPSIIPQNREKYVEQMKYYMRTDPAKAFSRAVVALLLADRCDSCMDILFPSLEYDAGGSASPVFHADQLFRNGHYREARDAYQSVLGDSNSPDRARAALMIGRMYRYEYGFEDMDSAAREMFEKALEIGGDDCPDAAYELYLCERDGAGTPGGNKNTEAAWKYLLRAAGAGSVRALAELGGMYYTGNPTFNITPDMEKSALYYQKGALQDDISCEKMYGRCLERDGLLTQARYWYFKAARKGDMDASVLLSELDLKLQKEQKEISPEQSARPDAELSQGHTRGICYCNASNEMSDTFTGSMPEGWESRPFSAFEEGVRALVSDPDEKRIIVFLADPEESTNLRDLCRAVGFLEHLPAKKSLIERIHFYVLSESDDSVTVKMVDSFNTVNEFRKKLAQSKGAPDEETILSDTAYRDWFYHIRICNPLWDASQYLLSHAPLFLPALQDKRQQPHIVLTGGGKVVPRLICDMLSVLPYTRDGKPLHISVLSENATEVRQALEEHMPELVADKSPITCDLDFLPLTRHELWRLFTTGKLSSPEYEKELQKILFEANYYIVAGDDERENVKYATWLRGTILSSVSDFGKLPFIAAYVRDNTLAQQAAHFSVVNEGIGFSWYNNYNLFCFGSSLDLYTFQNLEEGLLERRALALHMSYYTDNVGARKQAEADYWFRFYNRDSSRMSALSIIYKAYLFGFTLESAYDYGSGSMEKQLAAPLEEWIADPQHQETAARAEHERWNYFACSRGWRHATIAQMRSYLMMGNPRQQLYIAKLHPCIAAWQKLPEVEKAYNDIQRQRNPEWKDRKLVQSDYDITAVLPGLLRM